MVVPLPTAEDVDLSLPDDDEVRWLARGLVGAADDGSGLSHVQVLLLEAVIVSMTGVAIHIGEIVGVDPETFSPRLRRRNQAFRQRIVQIMLLAALVRRPASSQAMNKIGQCARLLSLDGRLLDITAGYAQGAFEAAVIDFDRNGYLGSPAATSNTGGAWATVEDDQALARRWESLGELPDDTLGRQVFNFYRSRGFRWPGTPGSAPPLLAQHDWVHVLADYGTTVENELEVFAFIARANDDPRAFSLLAMVVSLFETGVVKAGMGLFEADPGHLAQRGMAERLADAMRRGATLRGSHDFLAMDWFAMADKPVAVMRRELELGDKGTAARAALSVGPWDRGGISGFQRAAGQKLAAEERRPYEDFGARL